MAKNHEKNQGNILIKLLLVITVISGMLLVFLLTIPTHTVHVFQLPERPSIWLGYYPANDRAVYYHGGGWNYWNSYRLADLKPKIARSEFFNYWYYKQAAKLKESIKEYLDKAFVIVAIIGAFFCLIGFKFLMRGRLMPLFVGALALCLSWVMYYASKISSQINDLEDLIPDPGIAINPYSITSVIVVGLIGAYFLKPVLTKHLPKKVINWWQNWFNPMEKDGEKRLEMDITTAKISRRPFDMSELIEQFKDTEYDVFGLYNDRGKKKKIDPVRVPIEELGRHGWVVGGTGTGKTSTANMARVYQAAMRDQQMLILSFKPDELYITGCAHIAKLYGYKFILITLRDGTPFKGYEWKSSTINPLAGGDAKSRTDRLFKAFAMDQVAGDSAVYVDVQRAAAEDIIRDMLEHGIEPTFKRIYEALQDSAYLESVLKNQTKDAQKWLIRLSTKLADMSCLDCINDPLPDFKLDDFESDKKLMVYIDYDSMSYPIVARTCGRMLYSDLLAWAARRSDVRRTILCALDEFQEAATDSLRQLLGQGRSRGLELWISCQSVSDLSITELGGQDFIRRVWDNCETKMFFRQKNSHDAKQIAEASGTERFEDYTTRLDDSRDDETGEKSATLRGRQLEGFTRLAEKELLHPNLLLSLPKYCAAVFVPDNTHLPWVASFSHLWPMEFQLELEAGGPPQIESKPTPKSEQERFENYLASRRADSPEVLF